MTGAPINKDSGKLGYLQAVSYSGRGRAGQITYTFLGAPEPELVELLLARGVTRPVAETLAADHPYRVQAALRMVDQRLSTGWKPRALAASIVDAVRNPKKWGYATSEAPVQISANKVGTKKSEEASGETHSPRETALAFLKLHLRRPASRTAQEAISASDDKRAEVLLDVVKKSREEALRLTQLLLIVDNRYIRA